LKEDVEEFVDERRVVGLSGGDSGAVLKELKERLADVTEGIALCKETAKVVLWRWRMELKDALNAVDGHVDEGTHIAIVVGVKEADQDRETTTGDKHLVAQTTGTRHVLYELCHFDSDLC